MTPFHLYFVLFTASGYCGPDELKTNASEINEFRETDSLELRLNHSLETVADSPLPLRVKRWEIPDFDYYLCLDFASHQDFVLANVKGLYTQRHFWNHLCILRQALPQSNMYPFFEHATDYMAYHFKANAERDMQTDHSSLEFFRLLLSHLIDCDPPLTQPEYWHNPGSSTIPEYLSLVNIYQKEIQIWNNLGVGWDIRCIIDLIARNYLLLIISYLVFLGFDIFQLSREGTHMYQTLTNYERFHQCGSVNTYANILSQADLIFHQHYS